MTGVMTSPVFLHEDISQADRLHVDWSLSANSSRLAKCNAYRWEKTGHIKTLQTGYLNIISFYLQYNSHNGSADV